MMANNVLLYIRDFRGGMSFSTVSTISTVSPISTLAPLVLLYLVSTKTRPFGTYQYG